MQKKKLAKAIKLNANLIQNLKIFQYENIYLQKRQTHYNNLKMKHKINKVSFSQ